eukprot:4432079-Pyramimonas_sp.AAC.1
MMTRSFPDFLNAAKIPTIALHSSPHSTRPAYRSGFRTEAYKRGERLRAGSVHGLERPSLANFLRARRSRQILPSSYSAKDSLSGPNRSPRGFGALPEEGRSRRQTLSGPIGAEVAGSP